MRRPGWVREALLIGAVLAVDLLVWGGDRDTRLGTTVPFFVVPALSTVAAVILAFRWRHPYLVFIAEWLYALGGGLFLSGYQPFAALLVALYAVARRSTFRVALGIMAAALIPLAGDSRNAGAVLVTFLLYTLLALTIWGFARLALNAERSAEAKAHLEADTAVRSERLALARELHDIVAHSVSAMIMQAAGATTLVADRDARIREALGQIEKSGVQAMTELHRLLGLLRSVDAGATEVAHPYGAAPGLHDVDELVDAARGTGMDVRVHQTGAPVPLDASVSLTAYRVVQEALTNAMRYAGRSALAELTLVWTPSRLFLTVRDENGIVDGAKPGVPGSGYGLVGLSERVKLIGGHLGYGPTTEGFLVQAELPIGTNLDDRTVADPTLGAEDGT
jgi:signal transduction histidine kinase